MHASIRPLHEQLTLNTDLLLNCIADLSEDDWVRRPTDHTNSIAFLAAHLAGSLEKVKGENLEAESEVPFPVGDRTVLGNVIFLLHHDTYHIGQIAILRKQFGYPAMKYGRSGSG